MTSPATVPHLAPRFQIYSQPAGTYPEHSSRQLASSAYPALQEVVVVLLSHLVGSPKAQATLQWIVLTMYVTDPAAQAAFEEKWPQNPAPDSEMVRTFFRDTPPDIILASREDIEGTFSRHSMTCGLVLKDDDGLRNEIFLPKDVYKRVKLLTSASTLKEKQRWLIALICISHEMVHSLTKHLFSMTVTPHLAGDLLGVSISNNQKKGEAGFKFEMLYFGFDTQVEWLCAADVKLETRMDTFTRVLAKTSKSVAYELDETMIDSLIGSFAQTKIAKLEFATQPRYVPATTGTRRHRIGASETEGEGEEEEESECEDGEKDGANETQEAPHYTAPSGIGLGIFSIGCISTNIAPSVETRE
ncbi:hypothetical protein DFH07DRAFT_961561 [Mycena maculata]|uniref:Uncharacterized protein n=1 Tax=Mycena maculata TaxID=230809 RepID=A0AAD7IUN3_9AGAR|nr:hypothetical protein DFH07DRAFT_961561 [Mycena maculata]